MRLIFVAASILGLLFASPGSRSASAANETSKQDELARLQGTWQLLYAETNGSSAPAKLVRTIRVEIKGNHHSVYVADKPVAQTSAKYRDENTCRSRARFSISGVASTPSITGTPLLASQAALRPVPQPRSAQRRTAFQSTL